MSNPVEFSVQVGTLPANFVGTLAEYTALLRDLITITPDEDWTSFQVGSTKPTSNLGPWLKTTATGGEWWVWSATSSDYVPLTVSLPLIPNNSINASVLVDGSVTVPKLASDVGALFTGLGSRIDSLESTVSAGVGRLAVAAKNAAQSYSYGSAAVKVSYGLELTDTNGRYDPTNSRYISNETGWYWLTATLRTDTTASSTPIGIGSAMQLRVNGGIVVNMETVTDDNNVLGRVHVVQGVVPLNNGDYVEIFFEGAVELGSLTVQLTNDGNKSRFQCWKIA